MCKKVLLVVAGVVLAASSFAQAQTAAMVVNNLDLPNGFDQAQKARLEALGYAVKLVTSAEVKSDLFTKADAETFDVLVVSESIGSGDVDKLKGVNVPMMHQESFGWSKHFFTVGLKKAWTTPANGTLDVVNDTHRIVAAAGLSVGPVPFFTDPNVSLTTDSVASLVAGAVNLVQTTNVDGNDVTCIFAIEKGTALVADAADPNRVAANRIVGFSLPGNNSYAAEKMTAEAWALYDAAIAWLNPRTAAMIVNNLDLPNGFDQAQKARLEALGYEVTLVTGAEVKSALFTKADAETFDVLVVSESIGSGDVDKLKGVNVPMMHQESFGWSKHFFTVGLKKAWTTLANGTLDVVNDTHRIVAAAGLSVGPVPFFTDPNVSLTTDSVASLVAGAVNLVQTTNVDGNDVTCIFAIEKGTALVADAADPNRVAANRIVGFSIPGTGPFAAEKMTAEAWALYDAAIAWLNPAPVKVPPMVAHWPMDEGAGTLVADVVGGNDGVMVDMDPNVAWLADGALGSALQFVGTGTTPHVLVADSAALDFGNVDYSISMMVRYPAAPTAEHCLLCKGTIPYVEGVSTGKRYVIFGKSGAMRVELDDNVTKKGISVSHAAFVTGEWVNLVAVHDSVAGTLSLYADGVLQGTPADVSATGDISNGEPMFIGAYPGGTNTSPADIDDVRIFPSALTEDEIGAIAAID